VQVAAKGPVAATDPLGRSARCPRIGVSRHRAGAERTGCLHRAPGFCGRHMPGAVGELGRHDTHVMTSRTG
jgi:hypothetical protein